MQRASDIREYWSRWWHGFYGRSNYSGGLPERERARPANEDRQRLPGCNGFEYLARRIGDNCWLVAATLGESVTLEDTKEFAIYKAQTNEASRLPSYRAPPDLMDRSRNCQLVDSGPCYSSPNASNTFPGTPPLRG